MIAKHARLGNITDSVLRKNLSSFRTEVKEFKVKKKIKYSTRDSGEGLTTEEAKDGFYNVVIKDDGKEYEIPEYVASAETATGRTADISKKRITQSDTKSKKSERSGAYAGYTYAEISEEQQKLNQRENENREHKSAAENSPELLQALDDYTEAFSELRELLAKRRSGTNELKKLKHCAKKKSSK